MPIYEFYSPDRHRIYTFLARRLLREGEAPFCPDGAKSRMEKVVSAFAFPGRAKEVVKKEGEGGEMDPRMEREMMKMADEFSKMDEKNPDPRMMGKMMRRMMEASGQKLPGEMGEMLQRLEKRGESRQVGGGVRRCDGEDGWDGGVGWGEERRLEDEVTAKAASAERPDFIRV